MRQIPLTQGRVALVDDSDYGWLNRFKWYAVKWGNIYYAARKVTVSLCKQRIIPMHRAILNAPKGIEVDHRDRNGLNNQQVNLRLCTHSENVRYQQLHRKNTTGFKGVVCREGTRNPYTAQIGVNKKHIYLGCYSTPEAAAKAYDVAAIEHHRQFALTNKMLGLV